MKRKIALIVLLLIVAVAMTACQRQADKVTYNLSKEADNFNITRRVAVYNTRTDKLLLEVIGNLSVQKSSGDIDIIVEVGEGVYKKHFVSMNQWTTYVVEDISGADVGKYYYEINFMPEMLVPYHFKWGD